MDHLELTSLLENITGHLKAATPQKEKELVKAQKRIANSLLQTDDIGGEHLFANSNFHSNENIEENRLKGIISVAKKTVKAPKDDGFRTYIRTVPARTSQISGSIPLWANGAKAVETLGPFSTPEGRHSWVDIYKTTQLTTLYIGSKPILFFRSRKNINLISPLGAKYTLLAGTVWIKATLLSKDAPDDSYVGVKVKSGSINLNKPTSLVNKKVTLKAKTNITVALKMGEQTTTAPSENSPYGKDAREATFKLPKSFHFSWNGTTKKVTSLSIGDASSKMYGSTLKYTYDATSNPKIVYNPILNVIAFELEQSNTEFAVVKNKSKFIMLSGSAPIIQSYWFLPAAQIDIANPLEAEGNGGIILHCDSGLRATWPGLENDGARLVQAVIMGSPGKLLIADHAADISGTSQNFNLWKDEQHPHRSSANVHFLKNAPLFLNISGTPALEFITTQCNSEFKIDRPVKVNGEPFALRTKSSVVMLAASDVNRLIYLYDGNIIADNTPKTKSRVLLKPVAIALENALFKVSQANVCLLFGECSADWAQVSRANLFLAFGLYTYLPTLPDPYVGKLKSWERLFSGQRASSTAVRYGLNMLICAVTYSPIDSDNDNVNTGFYFGSYTPGTATELEGTPGVSDLDNTSITETDSIEGPNTENDRVHQITRIASNRKSQLTPVLLKKQPADKIALSKRRLKAIKNDSTRTLYATGNILGAVKVNSEYINEIKKSNNSVLESLGIKPDLNPKVKKNKPTLATNFSVENLQTKISDFEIEDAWSGVVLGGRLSAEPFALLDISSNANQMGVAVSGDMIIVKTANVTVGTDENSLTVKRNNWPFIVQGMQVKVTGQMARSFTLPQVAWEPTINLTPPDRETPSSPKLYMDPEVGPLFYEDDGGPTRIWNNNQELVGLAPIPVVDSLVDDFQNSPQNYTVSAFTLPFGLKAISFISKNFVEPVKPDISNLRPEFRKNADGTNKFRGGIQLSLTAGDFGKPVPTPEEEDSPMFPGYTVQMNNLLNFFGGKSGASNLGHRVTEIFNNEFLVGVLSKSSLLEDSRGVPVSRMDVSGYGANIFSDWVSPTAAMAQTSQAKFDVMMGRTAHEVIQVKSILYPWGIRVVRTITIFRTATGRIYRTDSGWKAESDGLFDFSYRYLKEGKDPMALDLKATDFKTIDEAFEFHPGTIKGLFNVRNIKDAPTVAEFTATNEIGINELYVDGIKGVEKKNEEGKVILEPVKCGGVYFDADIEIENVIQGHTNKRVVSKKILGYVQVAPAGKPLTPDQLKALLAKQQGSIGGDLDCVINLNKSDQQMRLERFDVNNAEDKNGAPVFVVAARGTVVLPKAGSWSVVQHQAGTGEVSPLPSDTTVPLIRTGKWIKNEVINPTVVSSRLLRLAHPTEILRNPSAQTVNFGFLQTTSTQKALFLTPSFGNEVKKLLSKTPPIFADAYRLMEGSSIFPNIGNAIDNFGKAMPMLNGIDSSGNTVKAFVTNALKDGGTKVLELMEIEVEKAGEAIVDQGMKMLQKGANGVLDKALKFDIPQFEVPLVDTEALKIYIEYNTKGKPKNPSDPVPAPVDGKLNFDVDSFADEAAESWKSRVNNLAMVVDLGDMKRLMTIKGNFDAKKSKETGYEGGDPSGTNGLPIPEIEFSEALQPVIDILEVLAELSQGKYGEALKKGLKIAMGNSGEIWEYKFEATKEIPLVRFPPTDELYNSAQTPLKLEASLALGVYFNAALKVTSDPSQLLPTAGAFLQFNGGLSVMCVSVGVGSIYAVGSVGVKIAADTKVGPSLELAFAFGVSIVVSLPVVGNASVTYMMGVTMYADKDKVVITALMTFKGNANLLGGIVTVTIMIEAKGIIERIGDQTNASAQVTFALDISIFLIIDISFSKTWGEDRQVA